MTTFKENYRSKSRVRSGRPRYRSDVARSNRVVTFVTDLELAYLEQIAETEERSLSAVVHRIIAHHMKSTQADK